MSLKSPTGRLARWALALQPYNLRVTYTPGKANVIADTLSRPNCEGNHLSCDICCFVTDLPTRSPKDLRNDQLSDPEIVKIVKSFEEPGHAELYNWTGRGYIMSGGVLYRYVPDEDSEEAQLVVPACARSQILKEYHDAPSSGHGRL